MVAEAFKATLFTMIPFLQKFPVPNMLVFKF